MTRRLQQVLLAILLSSLVTAFADEQPDDPGIRDYKLENADSHTRSAQIEGRWFSDQSLQDGGRRLALCERFADGTFAVAFRIVRPNGVVEESTEVGEWGTSGPVYFTITKGWLEQGKFTPATASAYFYDAYEILRLGTAAFVYRHYEMGDTYRHQQVGPEFKMPEPAGPDTPAKHWGLGPGSTRVIDAVFATGEEERVPFAEAGVLTPEDLSTVQLRVRLGTALGRRFWGLHPLVITLQMTAFGP